MVVFDALGRKNEVDKVLSINRLIKLGREVNEMKEGLNSARDMVCNLANNMETGQKAMIEDFKTMLGSFVSSFVALANKVEQTVGMDLDEMRDEIVGSEKFGSKQVSSKDEKPVVWR